MSAPRWEDIRVGDTVTVKMDGVTMTGPATVDFAFGFTYLGDVEVKSNYATLVKIDRNPDLDWLPRVDGVYESLSAPVENGFAPFVRADGYWYQSGVERDVETLKAHAPLCRLVREVAA